MKRLVTCLFAFLLLEAGCADLGLIPTWQLTGLDTRSQPGGGVLVLDNHRNWGILSSALDAEVKREFKGMQPPGNIDSWTEFWRTTFAKMNTGQEHPERYFAHVVQLRRSLELPDLPRDLFQS